MPNDATDPQTATLFFFGPVAAAYLIACAGWLVFDRLKSGRRDELPLPVSGRPVLDFVFCLAAAGAIFALGAAYRDGWLFGRGSGWLGRAGWLADTLIIYSPIAIVLAVRRQRPNTVFLSARRLMEKIAVGLALGVICLAVYSAMRGEADQIGGRLLAAVEPHRLVDFLPVFLEGVAIAFLFVRLSWLLGMPAAAAVPAMLFAVAHIPGQLADEHTLAYVAAFFAFNTAIVAAILWTVARSRDVIWIGIVHYLLDVAIGAV